MALCVPNVMILGHSFVRRLSGDLEQHFDDRAKSKAPINVKPAAAGRGGGGGRWVKAGHGVGI